MNQDPFWKDDLSILLKKHRLIEFVPTNDMTTNEKLNAITRFMIYLGLLLTVVYRSASPLYIPIIACVFIYIIHDHYPQLLSKQDQSGGDPATHSQMPSKDNPFMNVLMTDYANNPQRKPAGDIDLPVVQETMDQHFSNGLYKNVDDVWNNKNSQRQFYTNPSTTIPNDRESFMKWCWDTPFTCKDGNLSRCLKYEDVRGHGQIHS
jgi:hypothetical protein